MLQSLPSFQQARWTLYLQRIAILALALFLKQHANRLRTLYVHLVPCCAVLCSLSPLQKLFAICLLLLFVALLKGRTLLYRDQSLVFNVAAACKRLQLCR